MESAPKKEEKQSNKFDWADEGLSAWCGVVILSWSAILTLNYVTIPGVPQKNIDPTFYNFGFYRNFTFRVVPAKKDKKEGRKESRTKKKVEG